MFAERNQEIQLCLMFLTYKSSPLNLSWNSYFFHLYFRRHLRVVVFEIPLRTCEWNVRLRVISCLGFIPAPGKLEEGATELGDRKQLVRKLHCLNVNK